MLATLATKLREIAVIWGTLSGFIIAFITWYDKNNDYASLHTNEIAIIVLTILLSFIVWLSLVFRTDKLSDKLDIHQKATEKKFDTIEIALLKSDIDRFFNEHEHQTTLSEDEAKYVYMLQERLDYFHLNSFNARKLKLLLNKDVISLNDVIKDIECAKSPEEVLKVIKALKENKL